VTYERDRETVVTTDRRDGPGMGTILAIVLLALLILAAIWYFGLGGGNANPSSNPGGGGASQSQVVESPSLDEASPSAS
jgi:hypothetical protein